MRGRATLLMSAPTASASIRLGCHAGRDGVATPAAGSPAGMEKRSAPPPLRAPASAACDAERARFAIGERATTDLLERARMAAQADDLI
jgi:hypothetical protein